MKKWIGISALTIVAIATIFTFSSFKNSSSFDDGSVKVYLQNKCSKDVRIFITQTGGGGTYTIDHNSTKTMEINAGEKVYTDSDRKLISEITASSEGKTIVICE
jgi:hypothetical protein